MGSRRGAQGAVPGSGRRLWEGLRPKLVLLTITLLLGAAAG